MKSLPSYTTQRPRARREGTNRSSLSLLECGGGGEESALFRGNTSRRKAGGVFNGNKRSSSRWKRAGGCWPLSGCEENACLFQAPRGLVIARTNLYEALVARPQVVARRRAAVVGVGRAGGRADGRAERLLGELGLVPVAFGDAGRADPDLARLARRPLLERLRVHDPQVDLHTRARGKARHNQERPPCDQLGAGAVL